MLSVVTTEQTASELRLDLDELAREGARRMLAAALKAEVDDYLTASAAERDERGRRLVVRNACFLTDESVKNEGGSRVGR